MALIHDVRIPASGVELPAAYAVPRGSQDSRPGVIVVHEMFGLNDDIRRITSRFAEAGYPTVAPDLYARGPKLLCIAKVMRDLRRGGGEAFDDLDATLAWLCRRDEVDEERIGVAGFCMGGGFALLFAVKAPVRATAPFYGDVPKKVDELRGVAPVVASFGGADRLFAPKGRVLERHLTELGVPHDVKVYPGAGHSFMSRHEGLTARLGAVGPMKVGFDPDASEDAWERVLTFFATHLGPPSGEIA